MSLVIVSSRRFADHVMPPGHPERSERAGVMHRVSQAFAARGGDVREPRPATIAELARVHDPDYLSRLMETAGRAVALDADTFTSPQSIEVAMLAAGAGLTAVDVVLQPDGPRRALALVRPPGHHAERDRAMGFCLFNNVAVTAAYARASGLARVAIVDFDVHHGNGTERAFYDDPLVLFVSLHQSPYYPGTGAAGDTGDGKGRGFTVNLPLAAGAGDGDYDLVYREVVLPVLRQFRPELILVSAGFDAFYDDPLGGMKVSADEFGRQTAMLVQVAEECCNGRLVAVTEGGYDLDGLASCLETVIAVLNDERTIADFPAPAGPSMRGAAAIAAARPHLSASWTI